MTASPDRRAAARLEELLRFQANACGYLGSPLYRDLLERAADGIGEGGPVWEVLRGHENDPDGWALILRMMGAVHRLVLAGEAPELAALYADPDRDPDPTWRAFTATLDANGEELKRLIELPVQTNEVGRCAALLPGFLTVAEETGMPLRLLEIGSSAGLNLIWDRYRYEAEGFSWGPADSPLTIEFESLGALPSSTPATVAERRGCDPAPVDPTSEEGRQTLLAYVWPDQRRRVERVLSAIEVARRGPAPVDRAAAVNWLGERLAESHPGLATVVFHSIVVQYLSEDERGALAALLSVAGERADARSPLAWLRMEPAGERADLRLTTWPGGEECRLGTAGYHGDPVELC
ncbi:MAG TPA: DUF2332 family protein [Solirubrobacterales bacterium]|nr:DUF2332 family protein [Solirubrobacterales bacterium]